MLEHNDMYSVKLQLHYLIEYMNEYVEAYREYANYNKGKLNPKKVNIMEVYSLRNPYFFIRMDETRFRTKYFQVIHQ